MTLPKNIQDALPITPAAIPIGPITPGTGTTNLGKAEGQVPGAGDVGVVALVKDDSSGTYEPLLASGGQLQVLVENVASVNPSNETTTAIDISANGQTVVVTPTKGNSVVAVLLLSVGAGGTITFEVSTDGTNYGSILGIPPVITSPVFPVSSTSSIGQWQFNCTGYSSFRVRCTAFTGPGHLTGTIKTGFGAAPPTANSTVLPVNSSGVPLVSPTNTLNVASPAALLTGPVAQFDDTSPTTISENNFGPLRMSTRRELYTQIRDAAGNERGVNVNAQNAALVAAGTKATYRAAIPNNFAAAAGAAMFFVITGSGTKTLRIRRIRATSPTLTTQEFNSIVMEKWSTAPTGGTATTLTQVPLDSNSAAATATLCQVYTAAPTEGTLVGTLGTVRALLEATAAAVADNPMTADWDFRAMSEAEQPTLRGTAQAISLAFGAAPGSAVTMGIEVEWTEE